MYMISVFNEIFFFKDYIQIYIYIVVWLELFRQEFYIKVLDLNECNLEVLK